MICRLQQRLLGPPRVRGNQILGPFSPPPRSHSNHLQLNTYVDSNLPPPPLKTPRGPRISNGPLLRNPPSSSPSPPPPPPPPHPHRTPRLISRRQDHFERLPILKHQLQRVQLVYHGPLILLRLILRLVVVMVVSWALRQLYQVLQLVLRA